VATGRAAAVTIEAVAVVAVFALLLDTVAAAGADLAARLALAVAAVVRSVVTLSRCIRGSRRRLTTE
jgi:hypothetical protein